MREKIEKILKRVAPGAVIDVTVPENSEFGHYSTNVAMRLAQAKGKNPKETAGEIVSKIERLAPKDFFERVEIAGPGFINFWIEKSVFQKEFLAIVKKKSFGRSETGKGKKVIVEYSSPNIAKPMHVGHLRSTLIGDALANIHRFLGYKVIRWNYLGDWGTQFGNLIAAYKLWGDEKKVREAPIKTLLELYIKFHKEIEAKPDLEGMGREEFRKLEEGDKENKRLWQWFRKESLRVFSGIYRRLGVKFDLLIGESFYEKDLKPLIDRLVRLGVAEESEGSLIVPLEKEGLPSRQVGLPPALIRKSDGTSLYLTRELANLEYRIKKYKPKKILYVVGNEQSLHFEQLFAIAKILGIKGVELEHVKFGLVLNERGERFRTREGDTVSLEELIEKIVHHAKSVVSEKNPKLTEKKKREIAEVVGIGALKYNDLKEHRHSDVLFDWKRMLDIRGDSAAYIQYTYARIQGIKRKVRARGKTDFSFLSHETELGLVRKMISFPDAVEESSKTLITSHLAKYLYTLAVLVNKFYETLSVMNEKDVRLRESRLVLLEMAGFIIKQGLGLLGIKVLNKI